MRNHLLGKISVLALSASGLAYAPSAMAQTATTSPAAETQSAGTQSADTGSEEIVVTAQRRSERLQDVPLSVAALNAEQLSMRGITTSADLSQITPGVVVAEIDSSVVPYIRGVGSDTIVLGEVGSVATYIDGVYMPEATGGIYELANIESVEVLKGPQGTLFGRNAAGGVIHIHTRAPSFTPAGSIEATYGNYNASTVSGFYSGPISSDLAFSVSANYGQSESYINDLVRGGNLDDSERYSVRGVLLYQPNDQLGITFSADYQNYEDPTGVAVSAVGGYFGQTPGSIVANGPYDYVGSIKPFQQLIQEGVSLTVDYDFGGATLTSVSSYRYDTVDNAVEADRTPGVLIDLTDHVPTRVYSQEVQLTSDGDGPLTWLVGGFYSNLTAIYDPVTLSGAFIPGGSTDIRNDANDEIWAVFGSATYTLGDFEFTAGLRYNEETKSYTGSVNGFPIINEGDAEHTWTSTTPRFVVAYHPDRNTLIYASYTQGFKSGAYNTTAFPTTPIDPETVNAYEIGAKLTLAPWITVNGALFQYDREDVQVQSQDPISGLQNLENAARSRSRGGEIEINATPVENLSVQFGASYLDAEYESFPDALVYVPTPVGPGELPGSLGNTATSQDVSGQVVERSPKWTYTLGASYTFDLPDGGSIVPAVNLFSTTSYFWNRGNRLRTPGYTLINAELNWNLPSGVSLGVWGKNLGDEAYPLSLTSNAFTDSGVAAPPSTYGVRVRYRF